MRTEDHSPADSVNTGNRRRSRLFCGDSSGWGRHRKTLERRNGKSVGGFVFAGKPGVLFVAPGNFASETGFNPVGAYSIQRMPFKFRLEFGQTRAGCV